MNPSYQHYFLKGACDFLCGNLVAVFNSSPRCWQHKAAAEGDRAMRVLIFGKIFPGVNVIRDFHNSILNAEGIAQHMIKFRQSVADDYFQKMEKLKNFNELKSYEKRWWYGQLFDQLRFHQVKDFPAPENYKGDLKQAEKLTPFALVVDFKEYSDKSNNNYLSKKELCVMLNNAAEVEKWKLT